MTELRQIVKDAFKCYELNEQFSKINGDEYVEEVDAKWHDDDIIALAENRISIVYNKITRFTGSDGSLGHQIMLSMYKRKFRQLERFLKKYKVA